MYLSGQEIVEIAKWLSAAGVVSGAFFAAFNFGAGKAPTGRDRGHQARAERDVLRHPRVSEGLEGAGL